MRRVTRWRFTLGWLAFVVAFTTVLAMKGV